MRLVSGGSVRLLQRVDMKVIIFPAAAAALGAALAQRVIRHQISDMESHKLPTIIELA